MNKENCALKLVDEIILYYDARPKKHQNYASLGFFIRSITEYRRSEENRVYIVGMSHKDT